MIKRKRKKTLEENGAESICGDPNLYLKDMYYLSDKSADVSFENIEKCKTDLEKFKEKSKAMRGLSQDFIKVRITQ